MIKRKFSIPYSINIDVTKYLNLISRYSNNIENIYLGIPDLKNHVSLQDKEINKTYNEYEFLERSKGLYKRIVTYNSILYNESDYDIFNFFEKNIYPLIEKYKIDGFILTSLPLAVKLRKDFPELELHTSCNGFQWNIRQMELWRNLAGINIFNPPREAAKTPSMLKEMHDAGFKLKVLLNEACVYGCPYTINHACSVALKKHTDINCMSGDYANALRLNFFPPKWMKYIDEYVYCYKISGRFAYYEKLKSYLDAYILGIEKKYIDELATYGNNNVLSKLLDRGVRIKIDDIPEKTRFCEAKSCNKTCFVCSNVMSKLNPL